MNRLGNLDRLSIKLEGPAQQISFYDADGPIYPARAIMKSGGRLIGIINNYWRGDRNDPNARGGYYSVLPRLKRLDITDNPRAVRDLADYVEGRHDRELRQPWRELDPGALITIGCRGDEMDDINRIRNLFSNVVVDVKRQWAARVFIEGRSRIQRFYGAVDENTDLLIVRGQITGDVEIWFEGYGDKVYIQNAVIENGGRLSSLIYNRCTPPQDNNNAGHTGLYSLIAGVRNLTIRDNPQALTDLLMYKIGQYRLDGRWGYGPLHPNVQIAIQQPPPPTQAFEAIYHLAKHNNHVYIDNMRSYEYIGQHRRAIVGE